MEKSRLFIVGVPALTLLLGFVVYKIASMNTRVPVNAEAAMQRWPGLAAYSKTLSLKGGTLFFYDVDGAAFATNGAAAGAAQKPALVLLHGLGDEADTWRNLLPGLVQAGYRCIAPDLPGFGRSSWQGQISLSVHAEAVLALLRESGAASPERPAVVIGSSMGAIVAELIGFERPDLVQALALIDGCFPLAGGIDRGLLLQALPFAGRRFYRSFRENPDAAWESLRPFYHDLDALDEADKAFLRERVIARVNSEGQERAYFASLRSMDALFLFGKPGFSRSLRAFSGRALLLWGEADQVFPPEKAAAFRGLLPGASFQVIAGAGHLPHQEKPAETAAELLRFLAGFPFE
jgi:pimeloyl-ACP methyl ester carboxylesterase